MEGHNPFLPEYVRFVVLKEAQACQKQLGAMPDATKREVSVCALLMSEMLPFIYLLFGNLLGQWIHI